MPYALCPMPYALCRIVPHLSEKGYIPQQKHSSHHPSQFLKSLIETVLSTIITQLTQQN